MEELTIKHVNLCAITYAIKSGRKIALGTMQKIPLTRKQHVNHVIEGHQTIVSTLKISRVTRIIIEM